LWVNWIFRDDSVHPGQNVAQIAVPEILAIGLGKGFALAIAASGIGLEHKIAERRESRGTESPTPAPARGHGGGRPTMDLDDERIFLAGIVVFGQKQPALDVESIALP